MSDPKGNNVLVEALGTSLFYGGSALSDVPGLLKKLIREDAWRDFVTRRGESVHHDHWSEFVVTQPLRGLGTTEETLRDLCHRDMEALNALDKASQREPGRPSETFDNIKDKASLAPTGTSQSYVLRRLRQDHPELHARVLAGELKPDAAAREAGFRKHYQSVRMDDPDAAARTLGKFMDSDARQELARLLLSGEIPVPVKKKRTVQPCGTTAAYQRHWKRGEEACEACKEAVRERDRKKKPVTKSLPPPKERKTT